MSSENNLLQRSKVKRKRERIVFSFEKEKDNNLDAKNTEEFIFK